MNGQDTAAATARPAGRRGRTGRVVAGTAAILVAATTALIGAAASPAHAGAGISGPPFSTAAKANRTGGAQVYRIRTGNDGAFDRVVFDARRGLPAYRVQYVSHVSRDPSGLPVTLRGHYFLQITLPGSYTGATSWTDPSLVPSVIDTPGLPEIKQIQQVGEFENVTTFALGLERSRGFRVLRLTGPQRLVVDVLH